MPAFERPNILVFLFDSLCASNIDYTGLPTLSKLHDESAVFTRTYTPNPQSSPARASFFTGLDPCVHGLWTNGVALPASEQTFVDVLSRAGYASYLAGRYQLAGVSNWTTEAVPEKVFTKVDWAHGPLHHSRQNAYLVWLQKSAPELYNKIYTQQALPEDTRISQQQRAEYEALPEQWSFNHWVGSKTSEWLASHSVSTPFLAITSFCVGDGLGAEPSAEGDSEALNKLALQQADTAMGKVLQQLSNREQMNDTVVIVAAARGNSNASLSDEAMSEQSLRVPLLIRRPGRSQTIIDSSVSTMDIAPTILDLAKAPAQTRIQGSSLLGLLDKGLPSTAWALSRLRAIDASGKKNWQTAFCDGDMKLVIRHDNSDNGNDTIKLYDLSEDPNEQTNLAGMEAYDQTLELMLDRMIDARCALEDRTEPRIAEF